MPAWPESLKPEQISELIEVALGRAPADTVIREARVVNVFTETVSPPSSVALLHGRIASLGPEVPTWSDGPAQVIEAEGAYLIPGLIDAHTHLDSIFTLSTYCPLALAWGNTTAVSEMGMAAGAWGAKGCSTLLAEAAGQPMRLFFTVPPLTPPFPQMETCAGLSLEQFAGFLDRSEVVGVGEAYWPAVIDQQEEVLARLALGLEAKASLEGHAAGAQREKLTAYAVSGVSSCHEAITGEEALARLELGMAVQVREGFVRREMAAVVPALTDLADTRLVSLVTDLADPALIESQGVMNPLLAKAVALGVPAARAVAWCSLNPARHFGLAKLGGIAPGWIGDLVLVEDLESFQPRAVFIGGKLAAWQSRMLEETPAFEPPAASYLTMVCPRPRPEDFAVEAPEGAGELLKVRVIDLVDGTITKPGEATLAVKEGQVWADPQNGILKLAHISRQSGELALGKGFVRGWGIKEGALAITMQWDTCNLIVFGASEREMSLAASRAVDLGGGVVLVRGDEVLAELGLPLMGISSPLPMAEIVAALVRVEEGLRGLGATVERPFLTCQNLCFTGLPFVRLTDKGLVDVRKREFMDLFI